MDMEQAKQGDILVARVKGKLDRDTSILAGNKLTTMEAQVVLASIQDHVMEVFDLAGLTSLFRVAPSLEEAKTPFQ